MHKGVEKTGVCKILTISNIFKWWLEYIKPKQRCSVISKQSETKWFQESQSNWVSGSLPVLHKLSDYSDSYQLGPYVNLKDSSVRKFINSLAEDLILSR